MCVCVYFRLSKKMKFLRFEIDEFEIDWIGALIEGTLRYRNKRVCGQFWSVDFEILRITVTKSTSVQLRISSIRRR